VLLGRAHDSVPVVAFEVLAAVSRALHQAGDVVTMTTLAS
jgi:hypothetical protein